MARYKKLTAPEEILVELGAEEFTVGFRWLLAVDAEPLALTDYCFSWVRSLARHGIGTALSPLRVEYVQQRSNTRQVERSLDCEVLVGAPRNVVIFRASDATKPFVTRNAELLDLIAPQFEEQLRQYKEEDSFLELVRRTIQDKLAGHRPSIDAISEALHMGPRTLQRRLHDSGSSFQRILDEARHQMARYYLSNSALELNEAAYLLGFERAQFLWTCIPKLGRYSTKRLAGNTSINEGDVISHSLRCRIQRTSKRSRRLFRRALIRSNVSANSMSDKSPMHSLKPSYFREGNLQPIARHAGGSA